MKKDLFDILVVGAGHAGLEATYIASQFGLKVGLVSIPGVPVGNTPCNPSVGGVGKGQVVRELDAMGGLMGKLTDLAGIHYRTLNESKGYAVHSTRTQVDKDLYHQFALELIQAIPNVELIYDKVVHVTKTSSESFDLFHVELASGSSLKTKRLVMTTGTFLNGKLHCGPEQCLGGVMGYDQAPALNSIFAGIKALPTRFKTGTPARLKASTIDWSKCEPQPSDERTPNFHWASPEGRKQDQISCHLTRTNPTTMELIRSAKERSPLYNGQIKGVGPRYCPSIEDKAFRYPDRNTHHVFLEPEGLTTESVYPNGLSTSLPKDVQESFLRSIEGLEQVEILMHGYAVEYDVVDTTTLRQTLEHKEISGLYFAGQVNGTSGYEEAAGQGFIAGANAALAAVGRNPLILSRNEAYIGVLIEDLICNQRDEPYRLFTARSENRLYIREDNTVVRMAPYRAQMGLQLPIDEYQNRFLSELELLNSLLKDDLYLVHSKDQQRFLEVGYGALVENMNLGELLRRAELDPVFTLKQELAHFGLKFLPEVISTVAISEKYRGYIQRSQEETERMEKLLQRKIDWQKIVESTNISYECRLRIKAVKPETFGQLKNMEGIRPATLAYVAGNLL